MCEKLTHRNIVHRKRFAKKGIDNHTKRAYRPIIHIIITDFASKRKYFYSFFSKE